MLKRILSAFLLCLCVSPVWAGSFERISLFDYIDTNASDSVSVGGNKYAHCSGKREGYGQVGAAANGVDLYVLNEGSWKVYHCDGDKWSEGRDVPDCTTECGSELIVHSGDNQRFYSLYKKKNTNIKKVSEDSRIIFTKETDSLCKSMTSAMVTARVLPCPQEDSYNNAAECQQTCRSNVWTWGINKCKEGYEKKGADCVLKQQKCDDKEVGHTEDVDLGECQTDWTRRRWKGGEYATSCKKTCFDLGNGSAELRYVVVNCKAEYERVNSDGVICRQISNSSSSGVGEPSAQSTISESKQRCLESRTTREGKACCHWAITEATWDSTNQKCDCVDPDKEFKMNEGSETGKCVPKTAGSDAGSGEMVLSGDADAGAQQSSDEEYTKPTCGNCVAVGNCSDERNRDARIDGTVSAECDETDNQERRARGVLQQMYSAGQGRVTGVTVKVGDDTCTVESNSEFNCGDKKYAGCTMVEISGGGYKTITVPLNRITDGGTAVPFICLEPENCNCGTDGEVSDANAVVPGDISGAQGAGGNSVSQNAPAKPDGTPCTPTDKNAKSGKYQNGECIIVECNGAYYKVSDDKKSCVEDKKAKSQAKIDELQKNADAMKEKEQSTANKLLGGAAIGATGIGAMQAASAYSEQQADEEAETAMRAYLATFHCNYGGGINVKGGEKDVQLPGGNELIDLYAEYVNLANNLKVRKAALDLRPGIESEAILDSATSGLYDDVAIGKTSGAFTSLARALQDPEGEDAKAWAAQKDASAKKMKTGLTVAAIGAIGGAVGNLIINKDSEKENSKEILDKYKDGDLTGKVSKSPDGKLVAEPVNQKSEPEPGIAIQDKDLGQETNMNQNQSGNWVHIVKPYAVGFYCEDLFENVYRSCFAMNNEDYARFQQSKFSEITNNAEKCYQGLANCKQESHTLASIEEACIRAVASDFSIDVSGVNNANCTDKYKTDFTWKSHIFQEQSTVDADATAIVKDGQMILVSPDPSTGERVETVVEESQESTPKQDNVVKDHHHGDGVDYIKRIENITDANAAFNMLAQQFGKTPSDEVKNTYDGFVTTCRRYNGVLSIELDTLRSYERDMYQVLCYFPDLDQTPDIVKVAYNTDHRVLDNSVSISEEIRLSKLAPFKDTQYKKNEDAFWQRLTEFNSNWSTSSRNCKIPELPSLWACTKYSAMIRVHDRDGKMYLEMTKYDGPAGNSDNYFVGKR